MPVKSNSQVVLKKSASSNVVAVLKKQNACDKTFVGAVAPHLSEEELEPAPQHFEEGVTVTTKHLLEINLGDANHKKPTFIGSGLSKIEQRSLIELLKDYIDCFAWSHEEMPGLVSDIALHHLSVQKGVKPVQQPKRKYNPAIETQIAFEIEN